MKPNGRQLKGLSILKHTPVDEYLAEYLENIDRLQRNTINDIEFRQNQGKAQLLEELIDYITNGSAALDKQGKRRPDMSKAF